MASRERKPYLSDEVEIYKFPKKRFIQVRYFGPFNTYSQGWFKIKTKEGQPVRIPKICLDYNPKLQEFDKEICPYRKAGIFMPQRFIINMIVRDLQDNPPRRIRPPTREERVKQKMLGERWRIKDPDSRSWTPVRVHEMPAGLAARLQNMSELNFRRKNGKKINYDIADPRYGMDVLIKYDPDIKGPGIWDVQRAKRTRLTDKEMNYLIYRLDKLKSIEPETRKVAREEWKRIEPTWIPEKRQKKSGDKKRGNRDRDEDDRGSRKRRSSGRDRDRDNNSRKRRNRNDDRRARKVNNSRRNKRESLGDLDDLE